MNPKEDEGSLPVVNVIFQTFYAIFDRQVDGVDMELKEKVMLKRIHLL